MRYDGEKLWVEGPVDRKRACQAAALGGLGSAAINLPYHLPEDGYPYPIDDALAPGYTLTAGILRGLRRVKEVRYPVNDLTPEIAGQILHGPEGSDSQAA